MLLFLLCDFPITINKDWQQRILPQFAITVWYAIYPDSTGQMPQPNRHQRYMPQTGQITDIASPSPTLSSKIQIGHHGDNTDHIPSSLIGNRQGLSFVKVI